MPLTFSRIQGNPGLSTRYNVVVPGSSIPEWFINQSTGCLVTIELPPHWYNTKLMGLAVCDVFNAHITMGELDELGEFICFSVNESGSFYIHDTTSMHFSKADHIWFGYRPLADPGGPFRNQSNTLKVSFSVSNSDAEGLKKCVVRVGYE